MNDVKGKVVAITGAAMGMDRLTADKFAADGAVLALLDIRKDELDQAVAEIAAGGAAVKGYVCDLMKRDQIFATFREIEKVLGPVDVLINNAGVVFGGPLLETDNDKLEATIRINLVALMWTMKAVLPGMMRKRAGHIVNISSAAGIVGVPNLVAYCASKSGVIGLTEAMRLEMIEQGLTDIKFTIVTPSYVSTGMFEGVRPPRLSPWVKPEEMVDKIYEAFKRDRLYVRAPWIVNTVPMAKALLPPKGMDYLAKALHMTGSMKKWTGRKE